MPLDWQRIRRVVFLFHDHNIILIDHLGRHIPKLHIHTYMQREGGTRSCDNHCVMKQSINLMTTGCASQLSLDSCETGLRTTPSTED